MPGNLPLSRDAAGSDALLDPSRDHLVAQGIVTQRADVVDRDTKAGQVDGCIQRIAAVAP